MVAWFVIKKNAFGMKLHDGVNTIWCNPMLNWKLNKILPHIWVELTKLNDLNFLGIYHEGNMEATCHRKWLLR